MQLTIIASFFSTGFGNWGEGVVRDHTTTPFNSYKDRHKIEIEN